MAKREKFGKFVLLEEIDASGVGAEYRAAKLGQTGLEKIVSVLRLSQAISGNGDVAKSLMDQAKVAAQLQNPNVVKIYGIGKVDAAYYISYEFIEGKSLKAIFNRCRHEGFPFSVDHSLLIASKVCSALEYAHGRKSEGGGRYFHGLLTPSCVVVSYEGEVRVRGFGYWPGRVRDAGLSGEESLYLAPEQAAEQAGDTRSDIFAVGAIMYETLTGHALFESGRTQDVAGRLAHAKLQSPSSDDDALPKPIADILGRALAVDPAGRYGEVQEMRKAIDTLLFSGDFTPTTFNLAFFMHSLFREDIESESKALKEEKEASYLEFLTEEPGKAASAPLPTPPPGVPAPTARPTATVMTSTSALPLIPPPPKGEPIRGAPAHREEHAREVPHHAPAAIHAEPAGLSPKEAAAGFTFHKGESKSKAPLFGGIAALVLVGLGAAYFVLGPGSRTGTPPATTPLVTTLSAEALRVKQLEQQLEELKKQQEEAADKAKQETAAKLQKEAKAKGTEVDAGALQKAQEDAARKARADEEKRAKEEKARLEAEKAEAERMAAERAAAEKAAAEKSAAEEAARQAAAATLPPSTLPALRPGALVNITDAGVIAPVAERTPALQYPPIALRQRVEGTVEMNVLVDEKGNVADAQVVSGAGGKSGLNEAAIENVKRRKYRPATKDGIPVKVWVSVRVKFELPK